MVVPGHLTDQVKAYLRDRATERQFAIADVLYAVAEERNHNEPVTYEVDGHEVVLRLQDRGIVDVAGTELQEVGGLMMEAIDITGRTLRRPV